MDLRRIDDVLHFRTDTAPFLVHLTRVIQVGRPLMTHSRAFSAPGNCGRAESQSDAKYGLPYEQVKELPEELRPYFTAACLTETRTAEIHCLLDIAGRKVNLEPFGLVLLKENLAAKGVSPVIYLNNH
jgi:hypothetical protein